MSDSKNKENNGIEEIVANPAPGDDSASREVNPSNPREDSGNREIAGLDNFLAFDGWQGVDLEEPASQTATEGINESPGCGKSGDTTDTGSTERPLKPGESNKSEDAEDGGEARMGLLDHLNELRSRLVRAAIAVGIGFGICWAFVDPLFSILVNPLISILPEGTHAQYTTLPEAFFARMQIAFVAGMFLASPAIFYQIWAFVAPGLYDEEKKYIIPIAFFSAVFFVVGALFCYFVVFPFAFNFFISYSTPEIVITPKISDYLSFVLKLLIAFGLIFEMPIFTLFLARLGILTASMMRRARKYAIVAIFIVAAILTPPDVVSQLLMACPMLLLYEASIGVAVIFSRKPAKKADETGENAHE